MGPLKEGLRSGFERFGYRIQKNRPTNRFDGMKSVLNHLRAVGFDPGVVIDGGANLGQWFRLASEFFPRAHFHLIEPQPGCLARLRELERSSTNITLHPVAISRSGTETVPMVFMGEEKQSTGAQVAFSNEISWGAETVPASSLDTLFGARLSGSDRVFLKLDLQGHEIPALEGGSQTLESVEVILTEVQFFPANNNERPVFSDMLTFLRDRKFELYDIASLSGRSSDNRLAAGDAVFVKKGSDLLKSNSL